MTNTDSLQRKMLLTQSQNDQLNTALYVMVPITFTLENDFIWKDILNCIVI